MALRKILIVGATGKQGGAVIDTLLAAQADYDIYGLTRDPASASATKLSKRNVTMIKGDVTDPLPIFEKLGKAVWGVFSVTWVGKNEEQEAIPLINAAIANHVQHFVFTSVDRGGPLKSDTSPTYVPHFITKYNIEKHLIETAAKSPQKMTWTILRPVTFMDNFSPDFAGKLMARILQQTGEVRLQFVSTKDIGMVAARSFADPEQFKGKAISLAGDTLNYRELNKIFNEEVGHDVPIAPSFLIAAILWVVSDIRKMGQWFKEGGYGSGFELIQQQCPGLMDFKTWLRTESKWETGASGS